MATGRAKVIASRWDKKKYNLNFFLIKKWKQRKNVNANVAKVLIKVFKDNAGAIKIAFEFASAVVVDTGGMTSLVNMLTCICHRRCNFDLPGVLYPFS